ncbi:MAG: hypothetical protein LBS96_00230 [Oscillospiraceae bacterium]|jgi:hypothetical protein|nr:hypothetical protein [Oscillospiraceae bacterium]
MIRGIDERGLARGMRRSPHYVLTEEDIAALKTEAVSIGIPIEILRFNAGDFTGYSDLRRLINVKGNIFPDLLYGERNPIDTMTPRAVLAHEYYGHFQMHPSPYAVGSWEDEFWAHRNAALNAPNLTGAERESLILAAEEHMRRGNLSFPKYKEMRRILDDARASFY